MRPKSKQQALPPQGNGKVSDIIIRGASEHNLQAVDTEIARNAITVVTGVSGSGKSSLAFDTVLSEAQRRFFYTLSHYSRQFLDISTRPQVRTISGLSPAIGLAQNETQPSRRASVGTLTDMAELLGVLYAQFGSRLCPEHGLPTSSLSPHEMVKGILASAPNQLIAICAPLAEQKKGQFRRKLESLGARGFMKVFLDGKTVNLNPVPELVKEEKHTLKLIVDFIQVTAKSENRLLRSIEMALTEGGGVVEVVPCQGKGELVISKLSRLSASEGCPNCHYSWPKLDARFFSANSLGRCGECGGYGTPHLMGGEASKGSEDERDGEGEDAEAEVDSWQRGVCAACRGTGLNPLYEHVTIGGHSALDFHLMPLSQVGDALKGITAPLVVNNPAFTRVREELLAILQRVCHTGLSYLTLSRRVRTLSGGEAQRLKLAGILSENLRGVLYVLDEPSQGLHPHELATLQKNLRKLCAAGNTILMVDHDEYLMRHADWVIDMGPGGGRHGGKILARFRPEEARGFVDVSLTARYLTRSHKASGEGALKSKPPMAARYLTVRGASLHNLTLRRARFLRSGFNVVTGVSGAGKSSLVLGTFFPACQAILRGEAHLVQEVGHCEGIEGLEELAAIDLIDRKPIAKSNVSMPATYLDVFTDIRKLYEKLPDAQLQGLASRAFSLHADGGRCDECKGRGEVLLKMKFLADARVKCSICQGRRYNEMVLAIHYRGLAIADVLDLSLEEAAEHFKNHRSIVKRLAPALTLGLGYLKLGQPSSSLSGGEAQRLKLAPYLGKRSGVKGMGLRTQAKGRLLILEEPTQGLHLQDTKLLLGAIRELVDDGMTVILIEHSAEVIAAADWVLDLGPLAAEAGGKLVYEGPPAGLAEQQGSLTGRYFAAWQQGDHREHQLRKPSVASRLKL